MDSPEMDQDLLEDSSGADFRDTLAELVASLEADDENEHLLAAEGLASIDPETRTRIIAGLGAFPRGPGLSAFFQALSESLDPVTSEAALGVINSRRGELVLSNRAAERSALRRIQLTRSLVTAVDGEGRGSIAIESSREGLRRAAVFRCDVVNGVVRTLGRIESDSTNANGLFDEFLGTIPACCECLQDIPELAISLLLGTMHLGDRSRGHSNATVWAEEVLGPGFRAHPFPVPIPSIVQSLDSSGESATCDVMPSRAIAVLDRCPSWIDTSELTTELAEEIELREGEGRPTEPTRHAGAYRYLFEHHLIQRLGLYERMLLWMAWFWRFAGDISRSDSAIVIAAELADEQYAVPSHPFATALMTRSLDEARLRLRASSR